MRDREREKGFHRGERKMSTDDEERWGTLKKKDLPPAATPIFIRVEGDRPD